MGRKTWVRLLAVWLMLAPGAALALSGPLARIVALPGLIPAMVQQLIPMEIELPPARSDLAAPRVRIAGLAYCGGDGTGGAYALGVVYPEEAAAPAANTLSPVECNQPLEPIAQRIALTTPGAPWIVVIKIHATWRPWQLSLAVADAAGAGKNGSPAAALKSLGTFKSIATANLQILPPPGEGRRFDIALRFQQSTIIAAAFASGTVANPDPYLSSDPALNAEISSAPPRSNALADAQYAFINQMLALYAPVYEVPIRVQGLGQSLKAKNVVVSGGDRSLTLRGQLTFGGLAYNGAMHAAGDDLLISTIALESIDRTTCDMTDMIARLQCQAQQFAGSGSGQALSAALTSYYQGQPFHYSTANRPLRFTLGGIKFTAVLEALRSSSRDAIFSEAGRATIRRIGPQR
ncbi:MAG: hypothetical protein IVW54_18765 [Candidatus Binataceae bacterium]|nr:hypothetical protein [Candidatus Binataceae bacterium]